MKNFRKIFLVIVTLLVASSITYCGNKNQSEVSKSFNVSKGGLLRVDVDPGDLIIKTWSQDKLTISAKGIDEEDIEGLAFSQSGNNVTVEFDSDWGWSENVNFYITMPSEFNLKVKTTGGDIDLKDDLAGDVYIKTSGGDIDAMNLIGNFEAHTSGGDIDVGNVKGDLILKTQGGDVSAGTVTGGKAKLTTMGGDINIKDVSSKVYAKTYGGDITIGNIGRDAEVVTYGGDIKMNKANGSVKATTYGGDISLKGAKGDVKVSTHGGDISLYNIIGSVIANTNAGEVIVELTPSGSHRSKISSSSGRVELRLPANAKASIEAVIEINGWRKAKRKEYKIYSDFNSKNYVEDEDDREIRGLYELNGGGSEVLLKGVNSNIYIKKVAK